MKAHIPVSNRLPQSAKAAIKEYDAELQAETFRRWVKMTAVILHTGFGFGHDRCADFLGKISDMAKAQSKDEIFWYRIDKVVNDELKLDFPKENYKEMGE